MGVHWEVVGGLLGVSKGYKNHGLIGPGGYWRGLKVFLWNYLMFLTLKKINCLSLQVDNPEKASFVQHFIQKCGRLFYTAELIYRISIQIL